MNPYTFRSIVTPTRRQEEARGDEAREGKRRQEEARGGKRRQEENEGGEGGETWVRVPRVSK